VHLGGQQVRSDSAGNPTTPAMQSICRNSSAIGDLLNRGFEVCDDRKGFENRPRFVVHLMGMLAETLTNHSSEYFHGLSKHSMQQIIDFIATDLDGLANIFGELL
jgi:hypothetical protein